MIPVTALNHETLVVNCDLIKFIQRNEGTVITLIDGERLAVEEQPSEIVDRVLRYRAAEAQAQSRWMAAGAISAVGHV